MTLVRRHAPEYAAVHRSSTRPVADPGIFARIFLFLLVLLVGGLAHAAPSVLTERYDVGRTGANTGETALQVANVNSAGFGKMFSYAVDGAMQAQPLYVPNLTVNGAVHNVVFVATMNDKLYAFDADSGGTALWTRDFTSPPGVVALPLSDIEPPTGGDIATIGIRSTPVIDAASGTLYLVAHTKETSGSTVSYFQRLHAIDITTGQERANSPVAISASVPGTAADAVGGQIVFDPKMQNQRAGLAITNGIVVITWASHDDILPFHGWIMGYDAKTLAQVGVFCTTPDTYFGGIWQSGRAPAIDASGSLYLATGNAVWDGTRNWGDSILKFGVNSSGFTLNDWFTPSDWSSLDTADEDLGSSGVMLLPNTNLAVGGGKEGVLYLLNTGNLGREVTSDTQIVQRITTGSGEFLGGPAYWNSSRVGPLVYNWAESDTLNSYHFNGTTFDSSAFAHGTIMSPGHPGGAIVVSANGSVSGTGIVWASIPTSQDSDTGPVAGILRAFDGETLQEIWDSEQNPTRDRLGTYMKFVPPLVANGRVYMPSADNTVVVYGLLSTAPDYTIAVTPSAQSVAPGASTSYTVNVSAINGFASNVTLAVSGLPAGVTATVAPNPIVGAGSATLQLSASTSAASGTSTFTITGTSGTTTHSATASLTVQGGSTGSGPIVDAQAFGDAAGGASTVSTSSFSTAAANELLLAFVATDYLSGTNTTVTSVSGGGLTWTLVQRTNTQSGTSEIWRAFAPTVLSSVQVTASLSQSVSSSITVVSFNGVDTSGTNGSGAIGATASASAAKGAPSGSLVTTRANSLVLAVGNDYDNGVARTLGTGQTLVHQYLSPVGDTYWVQRTSSTIAASGSTVTINDTAPTGDRFNLALVEVRGPAGVASTYSLGGSLGTSGSGANVALSGAATATVTADASGNFTFSGLANGTYTVTPTKAGVTFAPTSQSVTVNGANVTGVAFTATAQTFSLSGSLTATGAGASVALSGAATTTVTADASGNFTFSGLANGTYTVTPTKAGVTFAPTSQSVTVNGANVTSVAFSATAQTFSLSGSLTATGAGASVALSGAATATVTADASGNFTFSGLANGTYTVTPTKAGVTFAPTSQSVTVNGANVTGVAFSATGTTATLAIDATVSGDSTAAATTVASPSFSTRAGNEVLLAFVSTDFVRGTNTSVSAISGGGLTWTLVVRSNTQKGTSEIWRALAPSALSGVTVTATLSQAVQASLTVMSFTGADTSGTNAANAIGATATTNAAKGAPTATVTTTRAGSLVIGVGNDYDNAIARTLGTGQTMVHQYLASTGDTYWVQMRSTNVAASGTAVTINDTAPTTDRYNFAVVEVRTP